jgi:hypothetical protein
VRSDPTRQCLECLTREPADTPVGQHQGAELVVEADGWRVPVEHSPIQTPPAAFNRQPRQMAQQLPADSSATHLFQHVEVLEVNARAAHERRKRREEEGEPHGLSVQLGEHHFRVGVRAEQILADGVVGGNDMVLELLVPGKEPDEVEDQRHIRCGRHSQDRGLGRGAHVFKDTR